ATRLKVLQTFKALHRTRMTVFKDDDRALTAARLKINEEFKKNKNEASEENIQQMIKMSKAVETILRENVLQAEHVGENKLGSALSEKTILIQHLQQRNIIKAHCARPAEPGVLFTDSFLGPLRTLCKRWHGSTLGLLIMSEFWLCFNCCIAEQPQPYRDGQRELHCVFVDLEKAYDRVPREELWYCMRKSGVAEKYVRVVQDMYERSRTVVRCAVGQTEEFNVEVGRHQGSALSPFLFAIVMDQLSEEVRQEGPWTMMFADDIVICSESREQVEENLERWRFVLERRGMKVSGSKTEYMCVNEREGSGTVRLQGEEVKKVQDFKYLGSTVQSNGECGKEKRRRRIDRSMIGEPTNFVHTAHVGSGDLFSGMDSKYKCSYPGKFNSEPNAVKGGIRGRDHAHQCADATGRHKSRIISNKGGFYCISVSILTLSIVSQQPLVLTRQTHGP
ncbi:hypothetical protein QTP70_022448, partial [Hemibagrus guttatus]